MTTVSGLSDRDAAVPAADEPAAPPDRASRPDRDGQRRIVASSLTMGAASVVTVLLGMLRAKLFAVLLGPAGVGLLGTLSTLADLLRGVIELGVNSSGVRQIAGAAAGGDPARVARTAAVLRRLAFMLGLSGGLLVAGSAVWLSRLTFDTDAYAASIGWLALAVFCKLLADAHAAVLQGLRRIGTLARVTIGAALLGTAFALLAAWLWHEDGVGPALAAVAASSLLVTWHSARRSGIGRVSVAWHELRSESRQLLRLGLAFMASGLLVAGTAYIARLLVLDAGGIEAAGLYQAAWTLGSLYVAFVLQAMGADFYPRLVGAAGDDAECNRLVNEQTQVSLLLAAPGVVGTLALAPLVLPVFYTAEFAGAAETLRWICLGMALRVINWPMGFILVARGDQTRFFATELIWACANVGACYVAVRWLGPVGAGIGFCLSYMLHTLLIHTVVRRQTGFAWSRSARIAMLPLVGASLSICMAAHWLSRGAALAVGIGALAVCIAHSAWALRHLWPGAGRRGGAGAAATDPEAARP